MRKIKIGGVPEHFNLPVHLAIENGNFERSGISLEWINFPGGSGFMKEALRNQEVDLCILLTEGIVADILNGNPSRIVSGYVNTPITWGIHASHFSTERLDAPSIFSKRIAISRFGSGSHLMPIVHAMMEDCTIDEEQFVEVGDIFGGIDALKEGSADIFYWEKFTTKPYIQSNDLKRVGEFISPWPCFVIAATNQIIQSDPELVSQILKVIHRLNQEFMDLNQATNLVSERYNQSIKDVERWYHTTEWATNGWVSNKMLEGVVYALSEANIISNHAMLSDLVWERNKAK